MDNEQDIDKKLWRIAKKRASFKRSVASYFIINSFLCVMWYITSGRHGGHFWPIWSILGWGIGIAFQYSNAYHNANFLSEEKEYEKLKREGK